MSDPGWLTREAGNPSWSGLGLSQPYQTLTQPLAWPSSSSPLTSSSASSSSSASRSTTFQGGPSFKVILVGDAGVGKTSLFHTLRKPVDVRNRDSARATVTSPATIGVDVTTRTVGTRAGPATLTVWDTAGVERYRTLTRNYFRNTHAVFLVCSVGDQSTLYSLPGWLGDVNEMAPSAVLFLVANKSDLHRQEITQSCMQSFADSHHCQAAFLLSAKTGEGVETALQAVGEQLMISYRSHRDMTAREQQWKLGSGLHVHNAEQPKDSRCC